MSDWTELGQPSRAVVLIALKSMWEDAALDARLASKVDERHRELYLQVEASFRAAHAALVELAPLER